MQEIKSIAGPAHSVTPRQITSAKSWGSFTGALEALLGNGTEAGFEIGSEDTGDLPQDATSNTSSDSQEQIASGLIVPAGSHGIRFVAPLSSPITCEEESQDEHPDSLTGGAKPLTETQGSSAGSERLSTDRLPALSLQSELKPRSNVVDWNRIPEIEEGIGNQKPNSPSSISARTMPNLYTQPIEVDEDSKDLDAAAQSQTRDPSHLTVGPSVGQTAGNATEPDSRIQVNLNEGPVLSAAIGNNKAKVLAEASGAEKSERIRVSLNNRITFSTGRTAIPSNAPIASDADTLSKPIEVDEDSSACDATSQPQSEGSSIVITGPENIQITGNAIEPDSKTAVEAGIENCRSSPPAKTPAPGNSVRDSHGRSLPDNIKDELVRGFTPRLMSEPKVSTKPEGELSSKTLDAKPQLEFTGSLETGENPNPVQHVAPAFEPLSRFQNNLAGFSGIGVGSSRAGTAKTAAPLVSDRTSEDGSFLASAVGQLQATTAHAAAHSENRSEPAILPADAAIVNSDKFSDRRIPERLILADFDVTRFEYKTETEARLPSDLQSAQMLQMTKTSIPSRDVKPVKLTESGFDTLIHEAVPHSQLLTPAPLISGPDPIQSVRLVYEPPPPPPVVHSISMDIGDPESQVRVVIRERGGNLNVQFGSSNERLRDDLQTAGPLLMRELQRNNPMAVTLDFSNFGSATDSDSQSRPRSQAKKFLKSNAEFAGVVETAYLPIASSDPKSL